jgi:hypothetical protein
VIDASGQSRGYGYWKHYEGRINQGNAATTEITKGQHQRWNHNCTIPTNGDHSTEYCKTCTSWRTLEDPVEVQAALQQRNWMHFGQAKGTSPTTPFFSDHVDWMASMIAADMILEGHDPFADSTDIPGIVHELLASFKHSSPLDAVSDEVTVSEWVGKMKT